MTNELETKLSEVFGELGKEWTSRSIGRMPIMQGQVLTFIDGDNGVATETAEINGNKVPYGVFLTVEGYPVPFSQIARTHNGLNLKAETRKEAIEEFSKRIDGNYSLKVKEIKKVESSFGEGKTTYLIFEEI